MSTKQDFINFLWKLHNICRNGRGTKLTTIPAMYETNNIIILKIFAMKKLEDKYEIPLNCRFDYLFNEFCSKQAVENEKIKLSNLKTSEEKQLKLNCYNYYRIYNHYCDPSNEDNVIQQLCDIPLMLKILKSSSSTPSSYAIKNKPDVGKNLIELFVAIEEQFTHSNIDLNMFSDAYEEWKTSSDGNSNKLSDQHFTPSGVRYQKIFDFLI